MLRPDAPTESPTLSSVAERIRELTAQAQAAEEVVVVEVPPPQGAGQLLGVLGTVVGIAVAAQAVEMVGEVHATLVWGGVKVALLPTIWGALILAISAVVWYVL
jgi:hypothetical protein